MPRVLSSSRCGVPIGVCASLAVVQRFTAPSPSRVASRCQQPTSPWLHSRPTGWSVVHSACHSTNSPPLHGYYAHIMPSFRLILVFTLIAVSLANPLPILTNPGSPLSDTMLTSSPLSNPAAAASGGATDSKGSQGGASPLSALAAIIPGSLLGRHFTHQSRNGPDLYGMPNAMIGESPREFHPRRDSRKPIAPFPRYLAERELYAREVPASKHFGGSSPHPGLEALPASLSGRYSGTNSLPAVSHPTDSPHAKHVKSSKVKHPKAAGKANAQEQEQEQEQDQDQDQDDSGEDDS